MTKRILYIFIGALLVVACSGSKEAAKPDSRYQRKPMTEVTQEQLELQGMLIDAAAQQSTGNITKALELYREVLAKNPREAAAWYGAGKMLMSIGRLDSALYYTRQAQQLDATNVWYQLQAANLHEMMHNTKALIAEWEGIVRQHPTVIEYYYNLSNAYLKDENVSGAIEVLDRVERRYGVSEEVSLQKQRLWGAIGKPAKAREELERLAAALPNEARYNAILAESYMQEKNYKKALQYYNQILAHNPTDENIHISLAQCYLLMGDYQHTWLHLRDGLRNPAVDCKNRVLFAGEMLRNEKFFTAWSKPLFLLLDTLLADCPATDGHAYAYGIMLATQERYEEAAVQFRNHLAVDSSQYDAWESLMYCVNRLPNHNDELFNLAMRASKLFPLHIRPYYIQASILHSMEGYAGAIQLLQRCESIGFPRGELQVETYYMLADCYTRSGDTAKALPYYEKALRLAPSDPYLLNSYAYTLAEMNSNLDRALEMVLKALKSMPDDPSILDTYAWILFRQGRCPEALVQMEKAISRMQEESQTLREHYDEIKKACGK